MTEILAEQMRSLSRRLEELAKDDSTASHKDEMMPVELAGSLNPKQLAELLGIKDISLFSRSVRKIQKGQEDQLTRQEMTELAVAFANLLAADAEDTQKAMMAIKRVSAKPESSAV